MSPPEEVATFRVRYSAIRAQRDMVDLGPDYLGTKQIAWAAGISEFRAKSVIEHIRQHEAEFAAREGGLTPEDYDIPFAWYREAPNPRRGGRPRPEVVHHSLSDQLQVRWLTSYDLWHFSVLDARLLAGAMVHRIIGAGPSGSPWRAEAFRLVAERATYRDGKRAGTRVSPQTLLGWVAAEEQERLSRPPGQRRTPKPGEDAIDRMLGSLRQRVLNTLSWMDRDEAVARVVPIRRMVPPEECQFFALPPNHEQQLEQF